MEIKLEQYRVFEAAAREKSFSAAARKLFISQPAVSQSVAQLEESLGVRLFLRRGRTVELTGEGELLYGYVHTALGLLSSGENQLLRLRTLTAGELRIGAGDTVSRWFLLPVIERFHREYPDVALRITNRTSGETVRLLQDGKLDLGLVNLPLSASGVLFEECMPVHDVFVAGNRYAELSGRTLSLAELSSYPLLMLERSANSRRWADRHFLSNGLAPKAEIELGAHHLLLDYAGIGLGIACVVREWSQHALLRGDVFEIPVDPPIPARSIGFCYLEGIPLSAAARTFIEMTKEHRHDNL